MSSFQQQQKNKEAYQIVGKRNIEETKQDLQPNSEMSHRCYNYLRGNIK